MFSYDLAKFSSKYHMALIMLVTLHLNVSLSNLFVANVLLGTTSCDPRPAFVPIGFEENFLECEN